MAKKTCKLTFRYNTDSLQLFLSRFKGKQDPETIVQLDQTRCVKQRGLKGLQSVWYERHTWCHAIQWILEIDLMR